MAGRVDGDAGGAVEEHVAVHVLDGGAVAPGDDERIAAGVGRRDHLAVALDDRLRLRAGQRGLEVRGVHRFDPTCASSAGALRAVFDAARPARASSSRMRSAAAKSRRRRASLRARSAARSRSDQHRRSRVLARAAATPRRARRRSARTRRAPRQRRRRRPAARRWPSSSRAPDRTSPPAPPAVFRSSRIAASNSSRPWRRARRSPRCAVALRQQCSSRPRKSVSRRSASSACSSPAQVKLSRVR